MHITQQPTEMQIQAVLEKIRDAAKILVKSQSSGVIGRQKEDGTYIAVAYEDDGTEFEVDMVAQNCLEQGLLEASPDYRFVGEEGDQEDIVDASQRHISADTLDGTGPFIAGFNHYATSVLMIHKYPVLAVICLPAMRRWHVASFDGSSAWLDSAIFYQVDEGQGGALRIAPTAKPVGPATGKVKDCYLLVSSDAQSELEFSGFAGKTRALGATASHLALVLASKAGERAVAITRAKVHDVAAGLALVASGGLEVRDLRTGDLVNVGDLICGALTRRRENTPPLLVSAKGDLFAGGLRLRRTAERIVAVDSNNANERAVERRTAHKQGISHRAVHIDIRNNDGRYLVWRRFDGRLEVLGGHVDWLSALGRGETNFEAVVRELREELNLEKNWLEDPAGRLRQPYLRQIDTIENRLPSSQGDNHEWVAVFLLDWSKDWGDPAGKWSLKAVSQGGEGYSPQWLTPVELARECGGDDAKVNAAAKLFLARHNVQLRRSEA